MPGLLVGTTSGLAALGDRSTRWLEGHSIDWLQGGWAVVDRQTIYRRTSLDEWTAVAGSESVANCVLESSIGVLVGGAEAALFHIAGDRLERRGDFDQAPGRDTWFTPWGGPPDVRSLAQDVDGSLYVNVHVGGVLVYREEDPVWRDTMDIRADVHQVIAHPDRPQTALVASAEGLGVTIDGAANWTFSSEGMHADYCRAVAVAGDQVYVSAALGSGGQQAAVYRGAITGGAFTKLEGGLPKWFSTNINTGCLFAAGDTVVIGDADGRIFVSHDQGDHFEVEAEGLPSVTCLEIEA